MHKPLTKQQSGFTIIEFLLALTILGILTSYAVPAFIGLIESNRVESIQRNFATAFKFTQSEAIKRNKAVVMCKASSATTPSCDAGANSTWQQGWYVFDDDNENGALDAAEIAAVPSLLLRQQAPIEDIRVFSGVNAMTFTGSGTLTANPGAFRICKERPTDLACDLNNHESSVGFAALVSGQLVFNN